MANRKYERFSGAPTVEPVTVGGWYELTDGRIALLEEERPSQ